MIDLTTLKYDERGLIVATAQDYATKDVLMTAYMNAESLAKTLETGFVHYYSRSRQQLWQKGETSGHFQRVKNILYDCDGDALLILVEQTGAACHTGNRTCFYRALDGSAVEASAAANVCDPLADLYNVIEDRRSNPQEGSYTNYLFTKGLDKMLKKVGEETAEVIIAAKNQSKSEITYEISDLMYHLSVVMLQSGVTWDDIYKELDGRKK